MNIMAISMDYSYHDYMWYILYGSRINKFQQQQKVLCFPPYFLLKYLNYKTGYDLRSLLIFDNTSDCC